MHLRHSIGFAVLFGVGAGFADPKTIRIPVIADAQGGAPATWHYTTDDPGANWADSGFADDAWQTGPGGFGSGTPANAHINTAWSTPQIWLRTSFTLPDVNVSSASLSLYHDEDVQIFLNGKPVFQEASFDTNYQEAALTDDFKAALKPGKNVLAITCTNTDGPGYIDAGLAVMADFEAATLVGDARAAAPADWSYTTADPGTDWAKPDFDASAWTAGKGGFGSADYTTGTPWTDPEIWLRTTFQAPSAGPWYALSIMHDDDAEVYVNGIQVYTATGWNTDYEEPFAGLVAQVVQAGKNTLAVHCRNNDGPQFIDVGLMGLSKPAPASLAARAKVPASGRGPSLVLTGGSRALDLSGLSAGAAGRLALFGTDGRALATLPAGGARYLTLPVTLGTGVFRYRWDSPRGTLQGTLLKLP
jgi:hypothetical protein